MFMKKKISILSLALCCVMCSVLFVGCGSTVYGKKFTYQGNINTSWSSLDESYGKSIDDILNGQMKENNIDWSEVYFGLEKVDLSDKNFKNAKEVISCLHEEYDKKVKDVAKDIVITFGTKEEMTMTASKGEEVLEYKLVETQDEGFYSAKLMIDGEVLENAESIIFSEKHSSRGIFLNGAEFPLTVYIKVKSPIKDFNGEDTSFIEINLGVYYSVAK